MTLFNNMHNKKYFKMLELNHGKICKEILEL